jgi:hypothetical protein
MQVMSTLILNTGVVHLPTFEPLRDDFVHALSGAARATSVSTDDAGDYFNMTVASKLAIDQVAADAIVLIPLFNIEDGAIANASILAAGPTMYVRLLGQPQPRTVFAECIAYSGGESQPFPIGTRIKFPPPTHLWTAKAFLVEAINTLGPKLYADPNTSDSRAPKRPCRRPLEEEIGEPADVSRLGTSKFMMNLDGDAFAMRDKNDIGAREKKLFTLFRMLDKLRWEYAMGPDYKLQTEEYRNTIMQQGRTRGDHKHKAFLTTSFLDRIQGLHLVQKSDDLELLLTGQLFVEGGSPTLELMDFAIPNSSERISTGSSVCPFQNRPLVALLRNLQDTLMVFFSSAYQTCLDDFIKDLEGSERPMELVAADFLKYSVEETLRKFFRVIRSERRGPDSTEMPISNPEQCAAYLRSLFHQLSRDMKDDATRWVEEDYYRMRVAREAESPKPTTPSSRTPEKSTEKASTSRPCAGHLGKQLKAVMPDGTGYKCKFGRTCIFKHIGKTGKSHAELLELIAQMPASAQGDLKAAIKKSA